jgi:hypothetical protein
MLFAMHAPPGRPHDFLDRHLGAITAVVLFVMMLVFIGTIWALD